MTATGSVIPGSEVWEMDSRFQKRKYRIQVAIPNEPPAAEGYPVIYALDGDAVFATFAEAVKLQTRKPRGYEPAVVVGIGYFSGEPFDMGRRCFDFTTPAKEEDLPERPGGQAWPENGGADGFLDFLEQELKPELERRYRLNSHKATLFGHSLGGLFVLHALFNRPWLFHSFVAGSPSIWWNRRAVLDEIPAFKATVAELDNPPKLLITIGLEELEHMVGDAREAAEQLDSLPGSGFHCCLAHFPEEGHVSVLPAAISRSVKFALS